MPLQPGIASSILAASNNALVVELEDTAALEAADRRRFCGFESHREQSFHANPSTLKMDRLIHSDLSMFSARLALAIALASFAETLNPVKIVRASPSGMAGRPRPRFECASDRVFMAFLVLPKLALLVKRVLA